MTLLTIILFSLGLSLDSLAVSVSCGLASCTCTRRQAIRFATILGLCHIIMPLLGWALTYEFKDIITAFDHWIAFILLGFLGVKMIFDAVVAKENKKDTKTAPSGGPFLLKQNILYGIATSIDALIAGMAMAMVTITILPASPQFINLLIATFIMGFTTFLSSVVGLFIGNKSSSKFNGMWAEIIGGVILIGIGVKILCEHLAP